MSLEKSQISWSAKQIYLLVKSEKINFNHVVQRSFVWERRRKTGLIESIILGYPVPAVYAKRIKGDKDNVYYIMDGKQRLSTIKQYLNDEFALTKIPPVSYIDLLTEKEMKLDISGYRYSRLPETLQDIIKDTMFSVIYFDNLTHEEERELFKRLNAGKPLTSKIKSLATTNDIENLIRIGQHKLFKEMFSQKSYDNKNHISTIVKMWMMLNMPVEEVSFEGRSFNETLEEMTIDKESEYEMNCIFDYVVNIHTVLKFKKYYKAAKKLFTEIHLVSLTPYLNKALDMKYSEDQIAEWIESFFGIDNQTSVNHDYNINCLSRIGRNINIKNRDNILYDNFYLYFNLKKESLS